MFSIYSKRREDDHRLLFKIFFLIHFFRNKLARTKTVRSTSGDSSQSSSGAPRHEETGSRNVTDVDGEFWDLLNNAKQQSEEEEDVDEEAELDEEDEKQDSSTESSFVQYDELR